MSKGFVVDRSINFLELEETIYDKTSIDRNKAGDDVLERGNEVRKGCDGVPEEDNGVPKGGDGLHERVYDSRCRHSESEEARFVPLISYDSRRSDGLDLMVGKHFDNKEELNTKLNLVTINGKFEMKVKKSTKSLKEVDAAEAYRLEEFEKQFSDMSRKYPKVAQYLEKEVMTTNIVETLNNMMLKAIEYPITAMIDYDLFTMGQ
ncbi:hypothetical protein TIFTF001_015377 [Ficus carica]|uniref:Uncharacterized protein n=1 Tax=Ficus carica TaxID=3494 RepID=A0AA88A736_FICCA|nr:hypothetical protein TIFTF001_015377 [Ficus carica]